MTKSTTTLATALLLMLCTAPALARDDGGFGTPSNTAAPKALGDNTAELIARGDAAYPDIPDFAAIEPAAGPAAEDETSAKPDDGKTAEKAVVPAPSAAPKPAQQ